MPRPTSPKLDSDQPVFSVDPRCESVVVCAGELDLTAANDLREAFVVASARIGEPVILDLDQVTFLDCSAIREFVRARSVLRTHGADLSVRGLTPAAGRVLDLAGIDLAVAPSAGPVVAPVKNSPYVVPTVNEMVESWRSVCMVGPGQSGLLMFPDPVGVLASIAEVVAYPWLSVPPAVLQEMVDSCVPVSDADPAVVVMQLTALGGIMRSWNEDASATGVRNLRVDHAVATLVASALEAVVDIGLVDSPTGLLNRRALDQDLIKSLATARRREQWLSVVMIDVEGLKAVNDRLGHEAGDELLRGVAASLTATSRIGDRVYRIGGDEFVLVLPDLGPDDIDGMMRRTTGGTSTAFTWGSASLEGGDETGEDLERLQELLETADKRMLDFRQRARASSAPTAVGRRPDTRTVRYLAEQVAVGSHDKVVVAQATGMLAQHFGANMAGAGDLLSSFARDRGEAIDITSNHLVDGSLNVEALTLRHDPAQDVVAGSTGTARTAGR